MVAKGGPRSHFSKLIRRLYKDRPTETLYHYTSLGAATAIVSSRTLWATDVRYFDDAAELANAAQLVRMRIAGRIRARKFSEPDDFDTMVQFQEWLRTRLAAGYALYVASFTINGNLLSQWRAYCEIERGVSLGFRPDDIGEEARLQGFRLGRCIYSQEEQHRIIDSVLDSVLARVAIEGPDPQRPETQRFHAVFEELEDELLLVAALLKHPAFTEEQEWRVVSVPVKEYVNFPVEYREGKSMLIPYTRFKLPSRDGHGLNLDHAYLGPTSHPDNSMSSLSNYLSKHGASPTRGLHNSMIPFRQT